MVVVGTGLATEAEAVSAGCLVTAAHVAFAASLQRGRRDVSGLLALESAAYRVMKDNDWKSCCYDDIEDVAATMTPERAWAAIAGPRIGGLCWLVIGRRSWCG